MLASAAAKSEVSQQIPKTSGLPHLAVKNELVDNQPVFNHSPEKIANLAEVSDVKWVRMVEESQESINEKIDIVEHPITSQSIDDDASTVVSEDLLQLSTNHEELLTALPYEAAPKVAERTEQNIVLESPLRKDPEGRYVKVSCWLSSFPETLKKKPRIEQTLNYSSVTKKPLVIKKSIVHVSEGPSLQNSLSSQSSLLSSKPGPSRECPSPNLISDEEMFFDCPERRTDDCGSDYDVIKSDLNSDVGNELPSSLESTTSSIVEVGFKRGDNRNLVRKLNMIPMRQTTLNGFYKSSKGSPDSPVPTFKKPRKRRHICEEQKNKITSYFFKG